MNSPKDATPPTRPPHSRRRKEMDIVPIQVGSYTRLEEIGRGSFATVYQGVHNVGVSPCRLRTPEPDIYISSYIFYFSSEVYVLTYE